ncbi:type 2 periplasmic-binding domain-containing protein [Pararhodonellum marinum]|uniref:hypothetical protein n=1 Tax=Pararhodonellum marinum TaxID=2755358 RepID=UPI0018907EDA|nr:hypothetical protein [Pararhodonellum marinum]
MTEKKQKKFLKKVKIPRFWAWLMGLFIFLGILQVGIYFGSDFLLRNYLQNKVNEASDGKYQIDFDRFNISLIERGFYFEGFILEPVDETFFQSRDQPFYKIAIPEMSLKGLGFSFRERIVTIGNVRFQNPMVQSRQQVSLIETEGLSPLEILEQEIRKSVGDNLKEIKIQNLYIDQADLLLENFISQQRISAENTNLHIKNIQTLQDRTEPTPFNADGFVFDFEKFEMLLADSVHTVRAEKVIVSSLEQFIKAKFVKIDPDVRLPSEVYYDFELDDLELTDADINQVFYTSDVNVGKLLLEGPRFSIYSELTAVDTVKTDYDLYPLVEDILNSINISELTIEKGKYLQRSIKDPNKNRVEAEEINFHMEKVYIGPDPEKKFNQFFYAQDAALDISKISIALADGIHWIEGERVMLSSFDDVLDLKGIRVSPRLSLGDTPSLTLIDFFVPELSITKANLKKIYNENILDIEEMVISGPSVLLKDIQSNNSKNGGSSLRELTEDYLKAIYVQRLEIKDGNLVLDNQIKTRQDSLAFGKISFVLENFALDESSVKDQETRIFLAEHLQLELGDYALKLADDLHIFTADRLLLNTRNRTLEINGFRIKPQDPENIQMNLLRYNKTMALDISIPDFFAFGIDVPRAYFQERLRIGLIKVPAPEITINQYKAKQTEDSESPKLNREDIMELLTSYFSVIQVDSINVENGTLVYENMVKDKISTFAEDNVQIAIKMFYMDKVTDPEDTRTFFSEELDFSISNYVFNIAEGKYNIFANRISFNSAREEIVANQVRMRPRRGFPGKVAISADVPQMAFEGVDLEGFLFENELDLDKVKLTGANVRLSINRSEDEEDAGNVIQGTKRERKLPKTIDLVKVDTIAAENARLNVAYFSDGESNELINTGINLAFYGFLLDSAKLSQGDIAAFFTNMDLGIDEFSLSLQDSVHTINFSKVQLNSSSDEIVFEDFRVTPIDHIGKPGQPVISAHIPRVSLVTKSLTSFQQSGDFHIRMLTLDQPDVSLYLESEEVKKIKGEGKEKISQTIIEKLHIDDLRLFGGNLQVREKDNEEDVQQFSNLRIILSDLKFDLTQSGNFSEKVFLNKDYQFEISDYEIKLPDSLNIVRFGVVILDGNQLILKDVSMLPRYGRFAYGRKLGHQTDVVNLLVEEIKISEMDLERIMEDRSLFAGKLEIIRPVAEIFRDKRLEAEEGKQKPMPQEIMKKLGFDIKVDSLIVQDGNITYKEFPDSGMLPGDISFEKLNAVLSVFQGTKSPSDFGLDSMNLQASTLLNGISPLSLKGTFFFEDPYPMHMAAKIGELELKEINSILETNAFVRIRSGVVRGGEWSFVADKYDARGTMTLRYNDLNMSLLEERTLEQGRGRKGVLTWVLNAFAVRSNNPRPLFKNLISSTIYETRDESRFVFNYWWRTTLSGFKGSLGLGQPKIPKKSKEKG